MTNWCQNRLTVTGSREDIAAFSRDCLSLRGRFYELDFEEILPVPPTLHGPSRGEWVMDKWGCDPDRVDYHESRLGQMRYSAAFASPWCAPEGIVREIACRHPRLTINFTAVEEGNEYVFSLNSQNGVINEAQPALTDALIEEVEGSGEIERRVDSDRLFYKRSATLKEQPMRHVRHWWAERRFKRALVGYPVYQPPHRGIEMMMSKGDATENYEFFLASKAGRIDTLRRFLGFFGLSLDFTDQTKAALDRWLATHAPFLYVLEDGCSFLTHNPEWTGARLSLNVIFDLAIFLGDFAIVESPVLRWEMDAQTRSGRTRSDHQFQRPVLAAATPLFSFPRDVIYDTYQLCSAHCSASYMWKKAIVRFDSRARAQQFVTKTLRHINLSARGDFDTANSERWKDTLAG
jgi:hypothetical protein